MKKIQLMIAGLLLISVVLIAPCESFAKKTIKITNSVSAPIYTAIRYKDVREGDDGGVWVTEGWYKTGYDKSQEITLYTDNSTFYIYTYHPRGMVEGMVWPGDINDSRDKSYWVFNGDMYLQGQTKPSGKNVRKVRFKRYYVPEDYLHLKYRY